MLRHLGGVGVFILAALDSSVLPTLGAVDALTIVLSARHPELWPYYAMCSTAGPVCGASVAYRLSRLGILHSSSNHSVANSSRKQEITAVSGLGFLRGRGAGAALVRCKALKCREIGNVLSPEARIPHCEPICSASNGLTPQKCGMFSPLLHRAIVTKADEHFSLRRI
jgi:hypothetical protein